jgi:hypothetical protein
MMNRDTIALAICGFAAVCGVSSIARADAIPYVFAPGGGTYSYLTYDPVTYLGNPAANASPDPNTTFFTDGGPPPDHDVAYYYAPTKIGTPGTVTFYYQAAPGETFGTGTSQGHFKIYYTSNGSISESISTNRDPTPVPIPDASVTNSGGVTNDFTSYSLTPYIAGADSFSLIFTLSQNDGTSYPPNYTQLFRGDPTDGQTYDTSPFNVITTSAVATPEPASLGLLSLGALTLLRRRRV